MLVLPLFEVYWSRSGRYQQEPGQGPKGFIDTFARLCAGSEDLPNTGFRGESVGVQLPALNQIRLVQEQKAEDLPDPVRYLSTEVESVISRCPVGPVDDEQAARRTFNVGLADSLKLVVAVSIPEDEFDDLTSQSHRLLIDLYPN
jgi:hypothetical protein